MTRPFLCQYDQAAPGNPLKIDFCYSYFYENYYSTNFKKIFDLYNLICMLTSITSKSTSKTTSQQIFWGNVDLIREIKIYLQLKKIREIKILQIKKIREIT